MPRGFISTVTWIHTPVFAKSQTISAPRRAETDIERESDGERNTAERDGERNNLKQ